MGKRNMRVWDSDVAECFSLFGGYRTAIYFEALRYRQQLHGDGFFVFKVRDVMTNTGLSKYRQKIAREVLEATGWIEVKYHDAGGDNNYHYRITDLAKDAIKKTPRRRNISELRQNFVNRFTQNYNIA